MSRTQIIFSFALATSLVAGATGVVFADAGVNCQKAKKESAELCEILFTGEEKRQCINEVMTEQFPSCPINIGAGV